LDVGIWLGDDDNRPTSHFRSRRLSAAFSFLKSGKMANQLFVSHNPASVWQVPDTFRSIYSHAAEVGGPVKYLFISGQFGIAPDGQLAKGFAAQCERAMDNVESLLATAKMSAANLVKLAYYVTQAVDFPALAQIRQRRSALDPAPSATAIAVVALARPEYLIEIEAVAVAPAEQDP